MALQPINGFKHIETHHCVTGSMRDIYATNGSTISEDLLLGLGEGVGYIYWQQKGAPPFIGGRAQPEPSLEVIASQRLGVKISDHTTASAKKAESALIERLEQGTPVILQVDMGFLPYFDFGGTEYHFGGHAVVACGYDAATREVLIADRDAELHPVPMDVLQQARSSTFKPFPPKNRWVTFDFAEQHPPAVQDLYLAISHQTQVMLHPPISNMGVKGIHKTAQLIPRWPEQMSAEDLKWTLFNAYIFISAVGGTGGGTFRYMFSRFLAESAALTGDDRLAATAKAFKHIGDQWEAVGEWFRQASEQPDMAAKVAEVAAPISAIAALEEAAWTQLEHITARELVAQ
ncbi:MAG TPA: BtrH N-terminal domain-containing protein [Phototrophicaceae bacterium]|nr:BtrH N-terminal domain-containing protein [Phototrophicaceae bacterium]